MKVATPLPVVTGLAPQENVAPLPGWLLMLSVTLEANDVTTFPETSSRSRLAGRSRPRRWGHPLAAW